jgi:hypothetical protein
MILPTSYLNIQPVRADIAQGVPFDFSPLPALTRHDWDLLVLILFLRRLMTSQTSGAGQEADKLGHGQRNKKVKNFYHAIAFAEITILTHRSYSTGHALKCVKKKYVIGFF